MDNLDLPYPISAFFRADSRHDDAVLGCFVPDGIVRDEGRTHEGRAAIAAWRVDAARRYTFTATPFRQEREGQSHIVTARVAGDFPGSPVDLQYRFHLERGLIASLEISP